MPRRALAITTTESQQRNFDLSARLLGGEKQGGDCASDPVAAGRTAQLDYPAHAVRLLPLTMPEPAKEPRCPNCGRNMVLVAAPESANEQHTFRCVNCNLVYMTPDHTPVAGDPLRAR